MYHIFVDFEMTCGFDRNFITGAPIHEIIEIGAVKLDEDYVVVDRFVMKIKPQYCTQLSRKCTKLTGITDRELADAPTLDEALILFEDWIGSGRVRIFSWSDSDKKQLEQECKTKGLYHTMPEVFQRWLDFQRIFMRVYGFERQVSLRNAMEWIGFDFEGKQHNALYDAINSARLQALMKDPERNAQKKELFKQMNNHFRINTCIGDLFGEMLSGIRFAS